MTAETALDCAEGQIKALVARYSTEFARLEAMNQTRKAESRELMDLIHGINRVLDQLTERVEALEYLVPRANSG